MKRILLLCSVFVLFAANAAAQKEKSWTEWNLKDAQKILTDSAWAQSQTEFAETPPSGSVVTGTQKATATSLGSAQSTQSGETLGRKSGALTAKYHVAFLTAKPVRAAFIRLMELQRADTPAEAVAERRAFIDRDLGDYIVVSLLMDGNDTNKLASAKKYLGDAKPETFKDLVYLERKDGKRVALTNYRPPSADSMGAKFIFPRTLEGKPFLDADSGEVRVYMEVGKTKLNRRFKVADMMFGGKLEY